jgi:hypothetical protein
LSSELQEGLQIYISRKLEGIVPQTETQNDNHNSSKKSNEKGNTIGGFHKQQSSQLSNLPGFF